MGSVPDCCAELIRSMDPVSYLCDLLAEGDQDVLAGAVGDENRQALEWLVACGFLVPQGMAKTAICCECSRPHLVDIVCDPSTGTHIWRCPDAGYVAADPAVYASFALRIQQVADCLAGLLTEAFGTRRRTSTEIRGSGCFPLGIWTVAGVATTFALAGKRGSIAEARQLKNAIASLMLIDAGMVLAIGETDGLEMPERWNAVQLGAAVNFSGEGKPCLSIPLIEQTVSTPTASRLIARAGRPSAAPGVHAVLDALLARGEISKETRSLGGVVARAWSDFYPDEPVPSGSTLRSHISNWRG